MINTKEEEAARIMADMEENVSVTAGALDTAAFYRRVERQRAVAEQKPGPYVTVLGMFLNLARRERSMSVEALAKEIDADPMELLLIEQGKHVPEPRIVSRLARALQVPPGKLMQLAGHIESLDQEVAKAAYAFAASANIKPLDKSEREALHEFVRALALS